MDPINDDKYNFNKEERGIALLFHNEFFQRKSRYKNRPGDNIDYKHMKKIFKMLGFTVCSFRDKTRKQILQIAREVAERDDHNKSDCFVCVVASHGEEAQTDSGVHSTEHFREHVIIGFDGKPLRTSALVELFDEDHCEGLKDKPKFFFIQACRIPTYRGKTEFGMDPGLALPVEGQQNINKKKTKQKGKQMGDGTDSGELDSNDYEENIEEESSSGDDCEEDYDTSDTDDDEEFSNFKEKFKDKTKENESLMRRECKQSRKDHLDGKGYTPEGDDVIMDEHAAKSGNEVNINEKTAEVNTKSGTQATSKKETSTTTQHNRSTSKPVQKIPMVTLVPCPEDTLIMFASLSGNFAVRGKSTGSWLLNKLYQCLKLYAGSPDELETIDFLHILTEVLQCMSHEMYCPDKDSSSSHLAGQFSPGCLTHCLTKHVYFTRKQSKRKGIKNYILSLLP